MAYLRNEVGSELKDRSDRTKEKPLPEAFANLRRAILPGAV
jgi:hypothetical protein